MGHFTLDNASNNDTAMEKLAQTLQDEREFTFDPKERRIRCFAHIINICVQHTINKYTNADFTDVAAEWLNSLKKPINKSDYVTAVQRDPLHLGRDCVRALRSSGQRRANFRQTIISGNDNQSFTSDGESITLPVVQVLRDCPTRWDSTYIMVNRLRTLRQVCQDILEYFTSLKYFQGIDLFLAFPRNAEIAHHRLSDLDWEVLQDIECILEASFYNANLFIRNMTYTNFAGPFHSPAYDVWRTHPSAWWCTTSF